MKKIKQDPSNSTLPTAVCTGYCTVCAEGKCMGTDEPLTSQSTDPKQAVVTDKRCSSSHPNLASLNVIILFCCVHMFGDRVSVDKPPSASGSYHFDEQLL